MSEAQNGEQQEPTMEEILASIRRIISEDEVEEGGGDGKDVVADDSDKLQSGAQVDELQTEADPAADRENEQGDIDDIMDASDAGSDAVTVDEEEEILELTEVVEEGEPVSGPEASVEEIGEHEIEVFESEPAPAVGIPHNSGKGLISDNPAAQTTSTFAQYTDALAMVRGVPIGNPNKSVEDIVKELLRPMLREWLDENLPALVERLVEREINKLAGQGEKD